MAREKRKRVSAILAVLEVIITADDEALEPYREQVQLAFRRLRPFASRSNKAPLSLSISGSENGSNLSHRTILVASTERTSRKEILRIPIGPTDGISLEDSRSLQKYATVFH